MKKFLALTSIVLTLNVCVAHAGQGSNFNVERLSAKGRAAYQELFAAEVFAVGVGMSGKRSECELALYNVLEEKEAIEALKSLISDGSYEGGLYGLLGLSATNAGEFNRAVESYKSRGQPPERRLSSRFFDGLDVPKGKVLVVSGDILGAVDWLYAVSNIQSGLFKRLLRRNRS